MFSPAKQGSQLTGRASVGLGASPWLVFLTVLGVILATEFAIMAALPLLLPAGYPPVVGSLVDSVALTAVVSPIIWRLMIRPLRQAIRLREQHLADIFAAIEKERRRIAHELHDGVGQSLTLLVRSLRSAPAEWDSSRPAGGASLRQIAEEALAETRRLALGLRPSLLDDLGLAAAIERVAADTRQQHPMEIMLQLDDLEGRRLPERIETALFRIFQEALTNIVKHSQATQASVSVLVLPRRLVLEIRDNGRGFELDEAARQGDGHLGLIGMTERAAHLGGELTVASAPGNGACITATIPWEGSGA